MNTRSSLFTHHPSLGSSAFPSSLCYGATSSCGDDFGAVGVDARLPRGLADGGAAFFLEQRGEHEQRVERHPRERGGVVGGAAERGGEFGLLGFVERLGEQTVFEPLKLAFQVGAKRRGRRRRQGEPRFRREPGGHFVFIVFVHIFLSVDG